MATKKLPLPEHLEYDDPNGYEPAEGIVLSFSGCPILTIRGSDDVSCIEEEDLQDVNDSIVNTASEVVLRYNQYPLLIQSIEEHITSLQETSIKLDKIEQLNKKALGATKVLEARIRIMLAQNKGMKDLLEKLHNEYSYNYGPYNAIQSALFRTVQTHFNTIEINDDIES